MLRLLYQSVCLCCPLVVLTKLFPSQGLPSVRSLGPTFLEGEAFLTEFPVISEDSSTNILGACEAYAESNKGWTTTRHYAVPTTDIPVHQIPEALSCLNESLEHKIFPLIAARFNQKPENLRVHDAFVVKYSMDGQRYLPVHTDQSHFSATIGLNAMGEYEGGGVEFISPNKEQDGDNAIVKVRKGQALIFKGSLSHGGRRITHGTRYIIALFIYCLGLKPGQ